ncbi:phage portal protein [Methylibium sp.]|uniref:phage portal protein n=1 Tax=Methylibium sp. TaxID=2067992 RepID=UPI003BAC9830
MANALDRLVAFFSPDRGLRRMRSRELLKRAYEGASQRDGWRPRRPGASANTDHMADGSALRTRSRALVQNVPYIAQGLRSLVANVVGTGIVPRSMAKNKKDRAELDRLWAEWAPYADADGRLDVYGMQAAAYRAMEQDGEVLVRIRNRRPTDGFPVPVQFQLLEIDWLDSSRTQGNGNNIVANGVESDVLGRVVGYWLFDEHPGETNSMRRSRTASHFVPAQSVIHLYTPERPGQGRGFPRIAPVIARVRDLQLYEDAELQRKNLETRLGVLASGDVSQLAGPPDLAPNASEVKRTGELGTLSSGGITQLPEGMQITVVEPTVAPGYVDYIKYQLHLIAAGWGVTYEMMTGDVKEVNFSSARVRMLDFRREAECTQWLTLIPKLCDRMWRAFVDAASLNGQVKAADYAVDHSTPKWDYVNPQQDVNADLAEIGGGLSSLSEKLRRRGYKPELVFAEIKSDFDTLKAMGILDVLLMLHKGKTLATEAPAQPPA